VPKPATKPRVLLVDDHPEVLKSLSRLLEPHFEVAGLATDGYEALDISHRTALDVVVLDITMPGLDGFQTAQQFGLTGNAPPIVFLTMHESEEYVAKGFRSGGRGYVVKTRLHEDLVNAMNRVLAGQLFVPSLTSLFVIAEGRNGHAAQFYPDDHAFVEETSGLLDRALRRGDVASVVAREHIREGIAERLRERGWKVGAAGAYGRYSATDSGAALSSMMRNGRPDPDRIGEIVAQLELTRVTSGEGTSPRLTIVGEINRPLISSGNPGAATDVERMWNDSTNALPFFTVCCYPTTSFAGGGRDGLLSDICAEHWAVA
jgi:DNA-binding NarL/FixJ family response regulator